MLRVQCKLIIAVLGTLLLYACLGQAAYAQPLPPPGAGYLDYNYGPDIVGAGRTPTEATPESKLWWNDGFWWGNLWNPTANQYHIYRLNWGTQTWEDTGTALDDRQDSRGDALWDGTKLYIASHFAVLNAANTSNPANYARLYRYSYDPATHIYTLDSGFPVNINHDKTETLSLAKDSTGRLWITYISRVVTEPLQKYRVYVNASNGGDANWDPNAALDLTTLTTVTETAHVVVDDIAAIISFKDNGGNKVGILWSNQISATNTSLNFAWHLDSNSSYTNGADWTLQKGLNAVANTNPQSRASRYMNIKVLHTGTADQLFAAIKFDNVLQNPPQPTFPEIGLLARNGDGAFVYRNYSTVADNDARPLLLLNEGDPANANDNAAQLFVAGEPQGSKICYKALALPAAPADLSTLGQFPTGNCGANFIVDASGVYTTFRDPSSTKQNVNTTTGLVVLASDVNNRAYAHNVLGNPPPVVTALGPNRNATLVAATSAVTVTFSKPINFPTTVNNTTFLVSDGVNSVAGQFSYNGSTRTVTFKPTNPLHANTVYTVKLTNGIKDTTNLALDAYKNAAPNTVVEQWNFSVGNTTVQFAQPSYAVVENGGSAFITVTLASAAAQRVTVNYATSNGTATAPNDYIATNGALTFNPGEFSKSFSIPIVDNTVPNPNKTVNLTLSQPNGVTLGTPATATLTIIDNDPNPPGGTVFYLSAKSNGTIKGLTFGKEDILAFNPSTNAWTLLFDGSDVGLQKVNVDCFDVLNPAAAKPTLLLSFDKAIKLPTLGWIYSTDIVSFTYSAAPGPQTAGVFGRYFTGANVGLTQSSEALDACHLHSDGRLLLSTKGAFSVPGLAGRGQDVLAFTPNPGGLGPNGPTSGTFALFLNGAALGLTQSSENVQGVWLDPLNPSDLYMTTAGRFTITSGGSTLTGKQNDIFGCRRTSPTSCSALFFLFNGDSVGFPYAIDGFNAVKLPSGSTLFTNPVNAASEDVMPPQYDVAADNSEPELDEADSLSQHLFLPLIRQ
ncbi:MAG: Calx-beta domain-containing protein [Caldilineaceae bacterium]